MSLMASINGIDVVLFVLAVGFFTAWRIERSG